MRQIIQWGSGVMTPVFDCVTENVYFNSEAVGHFNGRQFYRSHSNRSGAAIIESDSALVLGYARMRAHEQTAPTVVLMDNHHTAVWAVRSFRGLVGNPPRYVLSRQPATWDGDTPYQVAFSDQLEWPNGEARVIQVPVITPPELETDKFLSIQVFGKPRGLRPHRFLWPSPQFRADFFGLTPVGSCPVFTDGEFWWRYDKDLNAFTDAGSTLVQVLPPEWHLAHMYIWRRVDNCIQIIYLDGFREETIPILKFYRDHGNPI